MKVDVPIEDIPQLFKDIGLINEADKIILLVHLDYDNANDFNEHLNSLGFMVGEDVPLTCKGVKFTLELPDSIIKEREAKENLEPQCKSIW